MDNLRLSEINTKLEAYKLIHDPTRLFKLLYSKYGDIDEDYSLLIMNQLVYDKLSHLNIIFKERRIVDEDEEFLRRLYKINDSRGRLPKLSEYYKNYLKFFCNPTLANFESGNLIKHLQDKKAEIFYKNNYGDTSLRKDELDNYDSSSFSSIDNITDNKTIFDERNKNKIDNNLDTRNITITLNSESFMRKIDKDMDESNSNDSSFIKTIKNIVFFKRRMNKGDGKKPKISAINNKEKKCLQNIFKKITNNIKDKFNQKQEKNVLDKISSNTINKDSTNSNNLLYRVNSFNSMKKKNTEKMSNYSDEVYFDNEKLKKNNKLYLSPQINRQRIKNITTRFKDFNKYKSDHQKVVKRNKSYNINSINSNSCQEIIILNNNFKSNRNYSYYPFNSNYIDSNVNNKNKESNNRNEKKIMNIKTSNLYLKPMSHQMEKLNQFLTIKNMKKNIKINRIYNFNSIDANKDKSTKIFPNHVLNNLKNMAKSTKHKKIEVHSKYNLFKDLYSPLNKDKKINFQNKDLSKNRNGSTSNFNQYKKFLISNSNEKNHRNLNLNSLFNKPIYNNDKKSSLHFKRKRLNPTMEILKRKELNIVYNNKLSSPFRSKNNKISYSNSNYNINFTNLIFYGNHSPTNIVDELKSKLMNNNNKNNFTQFNVKKANNLNLMNLNSLHNSRNMNKVNNNNFNSLSKGIYHGNAKNILKNDIDNKINFALDKRIYNKGKNIFINRKKIKAKYKNDKEFNNQCLNFSN
jgi:hypothetical protein